MNSSEEKKLSLIDHLLELRACLIKAFIGWVIGAIIAYLIADKIIELLIYPLIKVLNNNSVVFFRTFPEVFSVYLKISIICGFIIGSPYIFFQIWSFIAPGLYPHEKKWIKTVFVCISSAFLVGTVVSYLLFLPILLNFLYSFGERFLVFKPFLNEYINFCLKFFLLAGTIFQVPSFMIALNKLQIITLNQFKKLRPYAIVSAFLISAILTGGGDPFNQIILAIPLTLLYEIGIIFIKITSFKKGG